jgi:hypothetical protein
MNSKKRLLIKLFGKTPKSLYSLCLEKIILMMEPYIEDQLKAYKTSFLDNVRGEQNTRLNWGISRGRGKKSEVVNFVYIMVSYLSSSNHVLVHTFFLL